MLLILTDASRNVALLRNSSFRAHESRLFILFSLSLSLFLSWRKVAPARETHREKVKKRCGNGFLRDGELASGSETAIVACARRIREIRLGFYVHVRRRVGGKTFPRY